MNELNIFLELDGFRGWSVVATDEFGNKTTLVGPFLTFEECVQALVLRQGHKVLIKVTLS